eukprot:m.476825 g.476825  ORF g.476825 m.476825 type:complete len:205 (+) comp20664_c0_seq1:63-677(+)
MRVALAVLALVAVAAAQIPARCSIAKQFEARQVKFDPNRRSYHNHTSEYQIFGRYSYDELNKRKFHHEEGQFGSDPAFHELYILELYNENKMYVTDVRSRECKVYSIDRPWYSHQISEHAKFRGYEIIGSGTESVELSQWVDETPIFGHNNTRYQTFTVKGCAPVRDDHHNKETGFHYEEFSDVTLGFHDPNIWIPPTGCQTMF